MEVQNRLGLHLRAASALAQTAAQFTSKIMIGTGKDDLVSAKSMTSLMMLGAAQGSKLKLRAEGPDAKEALKAVQHCSTKSSAKNDSADLDLALIASNSGRFV